MGLPGLADNGKDERTYEELTDIAEGYIDVAKGMLDVSSLADLNSKDRER